METYNFCVGIHNLCENYEKEGLPTLISIEALFAFQDVKRRSDPEFWSPETVALWFFGRLIPTLIRVKPIFRRDLPEFGRNIDRICAAYPHYFKHGCDYNPIIIDDDAPIQKKRARRQSPPPVAPRHPLFLDDDDDFEDPQPPKVVRKHPLFPDDDDDFEN